VNSSPPVAFVAFDLETTGIDPFHDVPVSYGFVEHIVDGSEVFVESDGDLINPGRPIPPGASAVHGISDDQVASAMDLSEAVEMIAARISAIWRHGGAIVGMNVSYDLSMIDACCRRLGLPAFVERGAIGPVLDVLIIDRKLDKWRKGKRKLTDLCEVYGVSLEDAHSAVDDAAASLQVYFALAEKYPEIAKLDVDSINSTLLLWHREWYDSFNDWLKKSGKELLDPGQYEWPLYGRPR
jgi:DNA polymerase III subunit epsilon